MTTRSDTPLELPDTYSMQLDNPDDQIYRLRTSQVVCMPPDDAFKFFVDPRKLYMIIPDWLNFTVINVKTRKDTLADAEFRYKVRWLGLRFNWHSRIIEYNPPDSFIDIQVKGPYKHWRHIHTFEKIPEGTMMRDEIIYEIPLGPMGALLHKLVIRRQLEEIFKFRAMSICKLPGK
jgi:ligand-binding SRPBCC domain-containing protein